VLAWTLAFALVCVAHFLVGLGFHPHLRAMLWALSLAALLAGPMTLVTLVQHGVRDNGCAVRCTLAAWFCMIVCMVGCLLGNESPWVLSGLSGAAVVLAFTGTTSLVRNADPRKAETRVPEGRHVTS